MLLVVALMGVGGVSGSVSPSALAQGAGDQQYEDPLGNSDSGSGDSGSSDLEPLSPSPQTSGSPSGADAPSASSGTAGTSATGTTTSSATAATLPNTGLDTRLLLLAGAVLLLVGVGLRMRNAPERF